MNTQVPFIVCKIIAKQLIFVGILGSGGEALNWKSETQPLMVSGSALPLFFHLPQNMVPLE